MKKRFRPKWSKDCNLLARVVTGVLPTPEGLLERQRLTELSAIECFAKGVATQHDFQTVADMLNIAETFVSVGVGPEVLPVIQSTQDALIAAKERHDNGGSLSLTAAGLQSLRDLYEYHDLQRTSVDWQQYAKTIEKTHRRILSEHPDVKVLT